jgi:hypothetical protein
VIKGVIFRFATDVTHERNLLAPFERIVIASGARYRFGLGPIAMAMLDGGLARRPGFSKLFSSSRFRNWFYYKARRETAGRLRQLGDGKQIVIAIGDAVRAGKSKEAIASAFEAALM